MTDGVNDTALRATLEQAGLSYIKSADFEILDSTKASALGNRRVHESTNRLILQLLAKNDLGRCIHVTGGARALMDPFHRDLCEAMARRGKETFHVLYNLPAEHQSDPIGAIRWNLEQWSAKQPQTWQERFLTLDTIGKRAVDMFAYQAREPVQYSVFGGRYVQLQGVHNDDAKTKAIWLIDSAKINDHLSERAMNLLQISTDIKESWFRDFTFSLSGVLAKFILLMVRSNPMIDRDGLLGDRRLMHSPEEPAHVLRVLEAMDFLHCGAEQKMTITDAGQEYMMTS